MKRLVISLVAVVAVGGVAACGEDSGGADHGDMSASPRTTASVDRSADHNTADVEFARGMIPHHRQAVEMAELAGTRAANPKVRSLAAAVEKAQGPEITTLSAWLTAWGEKVPGQEEGMDHGGGQSDSTAGPTHGMMTDAQMAALMKASGAAFDRMFLTMMIEHHNGAIAMAKIEQNTGKNAEATALAGKIITDQTAEITTMRQLLTQL